MALFFGERNDLMAASDDDVERDEDLECAAPVEEDAERDEASADGFASDDRALEEDGYGYGV
jgi:hypothetical protein